MIIDIQARSMKANVCEVWGFDSLYGQGAFNRDVVKDWLDAANFSPGTKFYFSSTSETSGNAVDLDNRAKKKGLGMFSIEVFKGSSASLPSSSKVGRWNDFMMAKTSSWHYETITKNFLTRLRNASCLSLIRSPLTAGSTRKAPVALPDDGRSGIRAHERLPAVVTPSSRASAARLARPIRSSSRSYSAVTGWPRGRRRRQGEADPAGPPPHRL